MKLKTPSRISKLAFSIAVIFFVAGLFLSGNAVAGNPFDGRPLYYKYCFDCHETGGGTYMANAPDFRKKEGLRVTDQQLLTIIKSGKGIMPGYHGVLTDKQILDVVTYIRNLF